MSHFPFFESSLLCYLRSQVGAHGDHLLWWLRFHGQCDLTWEHKTSHLGHLMMQSWGSETSRGISLTEEQALLKVVSKEEDAPGRKIFILLGAFTPLSTQDLSLLQLTVTMKCDALKILNTADTYRKDENWGFYFSKCWLILTAFGKRETHCFHSVSV